MSTQSESIGDLAAALAEAQSGLTLPKKNREVTVKTTNGQYKFEYTTLDAMIEHVRESLTAHGLWFIQTITRDNGETCLETMLTHKSGQWVRGRVPVPGGAGKMQEFGSALTYLKRYALAGMLGIASEDDDDANAADGNAVEQKTDKPAPPKSDSPPSPDRKAAAKKWGEDAMEALRAITSDEELSAWHKTNANAVAALRAVNEALHGRVVALIQKKRDDFAPLSA